METTVEYVSGDLITGGKANYDCGICGGKIGDRWLKRIYGYAVNYGKIEIRWLAMCQTCGAEFSDLCQKFVDSHKKVRKARKRKDANQ